MMLLKARQGLVAKKVTATRAGKTYRTTVWVKPSDEKRKEQPRLQPKKDANKKMVSKYLSKFTRLYKDSYLNRARKNRKVFDELFADASGEVISSSLEYKEWEKQVDALNKDEALKDAVWSEFRQQKPTKEKKTKEHKLPKLNKKSLKNQMEKDVSNMSNDYKLDDVAQTFIEYYEDKYTKKEQEGDVFQEDMDYFVSLYKKMWKRK